jgi:hypothetical protein
MHVEILEGAYTNQVVPRHCTLVGEGIPEIHAANDTHPAVEVVAGNLPGLVKAVLVDGIHSRAAFVSGAGTGTGGGPDWPMASGAYIATTDSRFPYDYPVPLHSRYEIDERTALDIGVGYLRNRWDGGRR